MPVMINLPILAVGLATKAVFQLRLCKISVSGFSILRDALQKGPVITVSNHLSTLDDPLSWGILPFSYYLNPTNKVRWTLGASDILFTNPVFSTFFSLGQTIETFRGKGVYQLSIDKAIQKLSNGSWIHFFGEGKVNQPLTTPFYTQPSSHSLPSFKWGLGRVILATLPTNATIIPMFITGFDKVMPEGRSAPWKYIPKFGQQLSVNFGSPLDQAEILRLVGTNDQGPQLEVWARDWNLVNQMQVLLRSHSQQDAIAVLQNDSHEALPEYFDELIASETPQTLDLLETKARLAENIRSEVTGLVQRKVEELGRCILLSQAQSK